MTAKPKAWKCPHCGRSDIDIYEVCAGITAEHNCPDGSRRIRVTSFGAATDEEAVKALFVRTIRTYRKPATRAKS